MIETYMVRIGEDGEEERFWSLCSLVAYLNVIGVGQVTEWHASGFETPNFHGEDKILLSMIDGTGKLGSVLPDWVRFSVENGLKASLL